MSSLLFPNKTVSLIASLGLSESDISDVFNHGQVINGKDGMVKKYSGYEIGMFYARDANTGDYIVTYVWKRDRR